MRKSEPMPARPIITCCLGRKKLLSPAIAVFEPVLKPTVPVGVVTPSDVNVEPAPPQLAEPQANTIPFVVVPPVAAAKLPLDAGEIHFSPKPSAMYGSAA